jgi:two-component system, chemotaxis family, sensor kinase CheA
MGTNDSEFLKRLLSLFKIEAREHLTVMSSGLAQIASGDFGKRAEILETVYREAHSLKGAARSVNLADIVSLCQGLESAFSALKKGRVDLSIEISDLLQQTIDHCSRLVDGEAVSVSEKSVIRMCIRQIDGLLTGDTAAGEAGRGGKPEKPEEGREVERDTAAEPERIEVMAAGPPKESTVRNPAEPQGELPVASPVSDTSETVRIATAKLDALLLQAEEMVSVKLAIGQHAAELRDLKKAFDLWKKARGTEKSMAIPSNSHTDRPLMPDPFMAPFEARLSAMLKAVEYDHRATGVMVDKLLDDMKQALMLPFSSLLEIFPRFVRELGRSTGKKVELTTEGGEIEIDRRVLEEMKVPLIHLIRNCVDHGLETAAQRTEKGKSPNGNMKIAVSSQDNKIEIAVSDDGAGIDVAKIKSSAVRHALISQEAVGKLSEKEALLLMFHSGVTTSPIITDISGRGLGLAIVREKVEKLNGTVSVETRKDAGTTFRMVVPLTLATFRGTLVRVSGQVFVLPSINVERVAQAKREAVQTVENRETFVFDHRPVSLVRLSDVLELKAAPDRGQIEAALFQVVVLALAGKRMAFMVDEVLHEQEVLVKPLGRQLSRVRNISAATVLGNGKVIPILNVSDLMKSAVKKTPSFMVRPADEPEKTRSVLVVEDSITARTLLKNILESAGYDVKTAVDGVDGFAALKSRQFDIVVSDVEMPRMNGFELTATIRSDKKFSELPVVLVTALDSREDRERGIDVGADAYIVKSSFDQSNLLEVIGRLT